MEKRKVLLVDDEEAFTRAVKLNLESTGNYTVMVENSGERALATAKTFKPAIILLDIMMPDTEGSEVATNLKGDNECKDIPIVFLTALVTKQEVGGSCAVISGHPFIAKPVKLDDLVACIERYIVK
ncbi:MAG: response regulator [Candidatus Omnitrophota bacterium]